MTIRIFALFAFLLAFSAYAGDYPCQGKDCPNPNPAPAPQPVPPPPAPAPVPGPGGFCDGLYQGFLYNQPGALALQIRTIGACGEIEVTGWWGGGMWVGQGVCQQTAPWQASVVFQYPGTAPERGVINVDRTGTAVFDGRVDFGDAFRVVRRSW